MEKVIRCDWSGTESIYTSYHDKEWGVPLHNDNKIFEFLVLEGMQAGLSWLTVLKKRDNFRHAFDNFNPNKIAKYDRTKVKRLLSDEGIIRNRLKIDATVQNAKAFLKVKKEFNSFDNYVWRFVNGKSIKNKWKRMNDIPAKSKESDMLSNDLKNRGFKFVGSTICYAHMQATGMVNDHIVSCFRYNEV